MHRAYNIDPLCRPIGRNRPALSPPDWRLALSASNLSLRHHLSDSARFPFVFFGPSGEYTHASPASDWSVVRIYPRFLYLIGPL
eukprot:6089509-Pyramimonas_sp.AAC.1